MAAAANSLYVDKDAWKYIIKYRMDRILVIQKEANVTFMDSEHDGVLEVSVTDRQASKQTDRQSQPNRHVCR